MHFLLLLPSAASVIGHASEHNIGSVFLWVLVLYGTDWSDRRLLGLRRRRSSRRRRQESIPLAILVSQWHFRVVRLDGFTPLWNLQGASRVCSYEKAGNQLGLPPF